MEPWRDWPVPLVSLTLAMSVPPAVALRRVAHEHDAAVGPRHRALHQQQVAFVVGLDDREVERGGLLAAGATRHAGAAEDPGRCTRWVPWLAPSPPKPWRFMTPVNPLPLLTEVTSTSSPCDSRSAPIS